MKFIALFTAILLTLTSCGKQEEKKASTTPETQTEVTEAQAKVDAKVSEVKTEVAETQAKVDAKVSEVKTEVAETQAKVDAKVSEVKTEVAEATEKVNEATSSLTKLKDALIEGNFEIACGKCMIKAEECKECQLTVKYKDQVYPITGYDIDVEKIGLCATSANADIVGTLKNNIFSVKTLENIKLNLPENLQKGADDALNKLKGLGF